MKGLWTVGWTKTSNFEIHYVFYYIILIKKIICMYITHKNKHLLQPHYLIVRMVDKTSGNIEDKFKSQFPKVSSSNLATIQEPTDVQVMVKYKMLEPVTVPACQLFFAFTI